MYMRGIQNAIAYMVMVSLMFIRYPAILKSQNWIIYGITVVISMFFPVYNYKRTRIYGFKKRWTIHLVTFVAIALFSYLVLNRNWTISAFYLMLLTPEIIIDAVLRLTKIRLPILDIGVVTSFILGGILLVFYRYLYSVSLLNAIEVSGATAPLRRIPMEEFKIIVSFFENNIYIVLFGYSFLVTMILYLGIWQKLELGLNYSYYLIIVYIVLFFIEYISQSNSVVLENSIKIIRITYIYSGIVHIGKTLGLIFDRKIAIIGVYTTIFLSFFGMSGIILFIIGVYNSIQTPPEDDALDDYRNLMVKKLDM